MEKNTAENMEGDDLIIGANKIENLTGKEWSELCFRWKPEFGFPLSKHDDKPALSRKALEKWIQEAADGQPLEKITLASLYKLHARRQLENSKGIELDGIDTISRFIRHPLDVVQNWGREEKSPITKSAETGRLRANSRDLLIWMEEMQLSRGEYIPPRVTVRIDRGNGDGPEFL